MNCDLGITKKIQNRQKLCQLNFVYKNINF